MASRPASCWLATRCFDCVPHWTVILPSSQMVHPRRKSLPATALISLLTQRRVHHSLAPCACTCPTIPTMRTSYWAWPAESRPIWCWLNIQTVSLMPNYSMIGIFLPLGFVVLASARQIPGYSSIGTDTACATTNSHRIGLMPDFGRILSVLTSRNSS